MINYPTSIKQRCIDCDSSTALPVGSDGEDGEYGGYSSRWKFSTNTAIADPTSNYIRFNSATYSSVTTILVSQTNIDGTDMEGFLTSFINGSVYGFVRVFKEFDSNVHWYGKITNVVDNGTYFTLTVTYYDHNSAFALNDPIVLTFSPTGPSGANGSNGSNGSNGTNGTNGVGYDLTTSSTSLTIGTGVQALTMTTGKAYIANASRVRIANSLTNYMDGVLTAYNSVSGVASVTVDRIGGSGTYNSWNISIIGDTPTQDTGWLDLQGFTHYSVTKPQYRIINKTLHFRGTCVIPLAANDAAPAAGVTTYSGGTSYTVARNQVYTGAGGCTVNGNYSIIFNTGSAVLQSASHYPDGSYTTGFIVGLRNIVDTTGADYLPYTAMLYLTINASGQLIVSTVYDQEDIGADGIGASPLRFLTSKVALVNDYAVNYRDVDTSDTLMGNSTNADLSVSIAVKAQRHAVAFDAASAPTIGGFSFTLDNLTACLA